MAQYWKKIKINVIEKRELSIKIAQYQLRKRAYGIADAGVTRSLKPIKSHLISVKEDLCRKYGINIIYLVKLCHELLHKS